MSNRLKIFHDGPEAGRLVMDREFAIKSSTYGTPEYIILQDARRDYPKYQVVRKTIKRNPKKEAFKGLTYAYMEEYMDRHNAPEKIRKEYEEKQFLARCHSIRYPEIKQWFLATFPDVKNWGENNQDDNAAADVA
jgi:hypothetical protein